MAYLEKFVTNKKAIFWEFFFFFFHFRAYDRKSGLYDRSLDKIGPRRVIPFCQKNTPLRGLLGVLALIN